MTPEQQPPRGEDVPREEERARLEETIGWHITGNLLATALIGGGAGYGLDKLLGTHFIVGIGLVVSMAFTLYYLWLRYGTH